MVDLILIFIPRFSGGWRDSGSLVLLSFWPDR